MSRQLKKRCLQVLATGTGLIALGLSLDMLVGRSIYHPLIYVDNATSWLGCNFSAKFNWSNTALAQSTAPVTPKNGMVVTEQHLASEAGLKILKDGGNAVDAAVAVGYALSVTHPCCGNLGGGGFMLIHQANGKDTFINFREKAPGRATKKMYLDAEGKVVPDLSTKGYLAVGVPGTVLGLEQALKTYGTLSRSQVMAPAIELAEKGFVLQSGDVKILASTKKFNKQPNVAAIFLKNGTTPYQVGDRLIQKDLAHTLKLISQSGSDAFYKGSIAQEITKVSSQNGGILTKEDFANYKVSETQP
ncbi:MAG: gamma-glutamyltransferase, partial [Coleofasciculaceae cyanobacterium]